MSINSSTVPSLWKSAKISPVYKSGNPDHVENYRPISVLPVLSKILETAVHQQLYDFLETNKLLYDCQFGFRRRHNVLSDTFVIKTGVPQGSILGPLMFIILFNDLKDNLNWCDIFQYADDTVILVADKNVQKIEDALNNDMKSIGQYCSDNELLLNLKKGKTEAMLFGTAQRLKRHGRNLIIIYKNKEINFVTEYVYLGNKIDQNLLLTANFERSYKKASGRLRLLQNVRRHLTAKTAEMIFNMMVCEICVHRETCGSDNRIRIYHMHQRNY